MARARFDEKTFNAEAFGRYLSIIPRVRLNELIRSKALRPNTEIKQAFAAQTGVVYATLPIYGRLGGVPLNYDGETDIVPDNTTTFSRGVVVTGRMKAWVERDFSEDITGGADFMGNVARQVSEYWEGVDQDTILQVLNGVYSMTGTENQLFVEKHTFDITSSGDGKVQPETLNTAIQQASGDQKKAFRVAIMHSAVSTNLENQGLLKFMTFNDANGIQRDLPIATWNGRVVLVDDHMPTIDVGGGVLNYVTYVLGEGAFDFEDVGARVPQEMKRDPAAHGGEDTLYTRQRKVYAPYGISFTKASMAKNSPTDAELAMAANWSLVNDTEGNYIAHKAIPIARLISRG